ncbi:MAG: hypothetical protein ACHQ17_02905 [Polyangia bacterium]|jgi:ElaB/YqjD/DUF883 family membrane-anchored ribosome-binding protein
MDERTGGGTVGGRNNGGIDTRGIEESAERELRMMRDRLGDVNERFVSFVRERPGTAILVAIGAGFVIGRILRS